MSRSFPFLGDGPLSFRLPKEVDAALKNFDTMQADIAALKASIDDLLHVQERLLEIEEQKILKELGIGGIEKRARVS